MNDTPVEALQQLARRLLQDGQVRSETDALLAALHLLVAAPGRPSSVTTPAKA